MKPANASPILPLAAVGMALVMGNACRTPGVGAGGKVDFVQDVKPILEMRCLECHNSVDAAQNAGLNLETRELAMTTGRSIPVIRVGDPDNSLFLQVLKLGYEHPIAMPPSPDKIWEEQQKTLARWIRQGAPWPDDVRLVRPQDWAR